MTSTTTIGEEPASVFGRRRTALKARLMQRDGRHRSTDHPAIVKAATAEVTPRERGDAARPLAKALAKPRARGPHST